MSHVFISYSRKNQKYARELAEDIRKHGFDVWIDDRIDYGDRWWRTIVKAIEDCSAFVIIMSPDAEESEWVERELLLAQRSEKPIFPLLLKGREFAMLITTQFANVSDGNLPKEDFYERLAQVIRPANTSGVWIQPQTLAVKPETLWWRSPLAWGIVIFALVVGIVATLLMSGGGEEANLTSIELAETETRQAEIAFVASDTPTETLTPSDTPIETLTPSDTPTETLIPSDTPTETLIPSDTPTETLIPSDTPTETLIPSDTPTETLAPSDTPQPSQTLLPSERTIQGQMEVGGVNIPVRFGPSLDFAVIRTVRNETFPITGITNDGQYYRILIDGIDGYMAKNNYIEVSGSNFEVLDVASVPTPLPSATRFVTATFVPGTPTPRATTIAQNQIIFEENFEDRYFDWTYQDVTWDFVNEGNENTVLQASTNVGYGGFEFGTRDWNNYAISLRINKTESDAGITIGFYSNTWEYEYRAAFLMNGLASASVAKIVEGSWIQFQRFGVLESLNFQDYQWNNIVIMRRGDQIEIIVNGSTIGVYTDSEFDGGSVRIELDPDSTYWLDDIIVWSLD